MDTRTSPRLRLDRLREAMAAASVQALLVPSSDPHLSEYLPGRWQGRQWFSGFTGSMGTLVVTVDDAALFADSRYWVQAEAELAGTGVDWCKIPTGATPRTSTGWPPRCPPAARWRWTARCWAWPPRSNCAALDKAGVRCAPTSTCWPPCGPSARRCRCSRSTSTARRRPPHRARTKLARVREAMARARCHAPLRLDRRRHRLDHQPARQRRHYNPVFLAHLLIDLDRRPRCSSATARSAADLAAALAADGVRTGALRQAAAGRWPRCRGAACCWSTRGASPGLRQAVAPACGWSRPSTPARWPRAARRRRGGVRARGDGRGRRRDVRVLRLVRRPRWRATSASDRADHRRTAERRARPAPGFVGLSFSTIAGFNANGAMPHYRATPESHAVIEGDGLLLIDSAASTWAAPPTSRACGRSARPARR
jgi:Xaa-Pro aminopeptidase